MSQLMTSSTPVGTTDATSAANSAELVRQHRRAVRAVAEIYGEDPKELESKTVAELERNRRLVSNIFETRDDRRRADVVSIIAASCVSCKGTTNREDDPAIIAKDIEEITDPQLRDVLYSKYWLGRSLDEISAVHEMRAQGVHQIHSRALKKLGYEIPDTWRSLGKMRMTASTDDALHDRAGELFVDAMAASTQSRAKMRKLYIGERTVRVEYGRAWIEAPQRFSIAEQRLMVADERATYQRKKTFTVMVMPDVFALEITLFMNNDGTRSASALWVSGNESVAVLDASEELLTICGPNTPALDLGSTPVPIEIWLRETGGL